MGFDPETVNKGMGLSSIRERAELSGGASELQSGMGKGTTIRVSWPSQMRGEVGTNKPMGTMYGNHKAQVSEEAID